MHEQLDFTCEGMKLGPYISQHRAKPGVNLYELVLNNVFLDMTTEVQETKENIDKLDFITIKTFLLQRTPLRKWKDNSQNGRKYKQSAYLNGTFNQNIKNSLHIYI